VPGAADGARYDGASGTGTATLDISPDIQSLSFSGTGTFAGTFAFGANTISLNSTGTLFVGATTMTVTGTPQIILTNNSATARTISPQAVTEANSISFRITAGTGTLSINTGSVRDLDFTDGTNPTGYAGAAQNMAPTIYGNFKASTGMTKTAGTGTFTFAATSGTKTITTAAVVFDNPFTFNGVGGTWQLQDALTSGNTRTCTLTAGTLDLNDYALTTGIFSSSNANARTLNFGSTNFARIIITGSGTTVCNTSTATGLTVVGTGYKQIILDYAGGVGTRTVTGASVATAIEGTNILDYFVASCSDTITFTSASAYGTINFDFFGPFAGIFTNNAIFIYGNFTLASGMTLNSGANALTFKATSSFLISTNNITINNPITFDGIGGEWEFLDALTLGSTQPLTMTNGTLQLKSGTTSTVGSFVTTGTNQKFLQATTPGSQATLSDASGTNSVSYLTIQDSNATGGAIFYAAGPTNVDAGNNTGWIFFPTPAESNEITMRLRSFTQPRRF
jgi:hypothetical protein